MRSRGRHAVLLVFLAVLLPATGFAGCGFGAGGDWWRGGGGPLGYLDVQNSPLSLEHITEVRIAQAGVDVQVEEIDIAPSWYWRVGLDPGVYDVQLAWSNAAVDQFPGVVIEDDDATEVVGQEP